MALLKGNHSASYLTIHRTHICERTNLQKTLLLGFQEEEKKAAPVFNHHKVFLHVLHKWWESWGRFTGIKGWSRTPISVKDGEKRVAIRWMERGRRVSVVSMETVLREANRILSTRKHTHTHTRETERDRVERILSFGAQGERERSK